MASCRHWRRQRGLRRRALGGPTGGEIRRHERNRIEGGAASGGLGARTAYRAGTRGAGRGAAGARRGPGGDPQGRARGPHVLPGESRRDPGRPGGNRGGGARGHPAPPAVRAAPHRRTGRQGHRHRIDQGQPGVRREPAVQPAIHRGKRGNRRLRHRRAGDRPVARSLVDPARGPAEGDAPRDDPD